MTIKHSLIIPPLLLLLALSGNTASAAPAPIDFSIYEITSYGGSQDQSGTVNVDSDNAGVTLTGNRWQKISFPYAVTENTIIEFDFDSSVRGEIHGIGFDNSNSIASDRTFRLYGSQRWGNGTYADYAGNGTQHYTIPVGQFYTGTMQYLFFVNDHDVSSPTATSHFSNLIIHEGDLPRTSPEITSDPEISATVNSPYLYDADGKVDAEGTPPVLFELATGPEGMSVSDEGSVSWTPDSNQTGEHPVSIRASDETGTTTQSFTVTVYDPPPANAISFATHTFSI